MQSLWGAALVLLLATSANAAEPPAHNTLWFEQPDDPVTGRAGPPDFAAVAKSVRQSVVSITAIGPPDNLSTDSDRPTAREFFERFYGGAEPPTKGMASGFVIRSDGYILTNEHVVEEASALAVTLGAEDDGRSYPAIVVGRDDLSDLALIKIDAGRPLTPLPLGDSSHIAVGDWVTAVGNPFGLSNSVSVGVVSFIGRRDINPSGRPGYYDFIQTDAAINPGNSGGPLVDRFGRVVGISAAVNANGQGIGFAIPINMAKDVLPALYDTGTLKRSFLGVSIQDLSPDLAESFGAKQGVVVTEVTPNGPAAAAGVQVGDVITNFDGTEIERAWRLRWLASGAGPGRRVKLQVLRGKGPVVLEAALAPLPGGAEKFHREPMPHLRPDLEPLGFALSGLVAVSTGHGMRVSSVDPLSRAYVAGLREGDVVITAQDKPIKSPKDVQLLTAHAKGSIVRLFIQRGVRPMFLAFHCEN